MAFCDLDCDIEIAEALIQDLISTVLENCADDLDLFNRFISKGLIEKLKTVCQQPFTRMTYSQAIQELEERNSHLNTLLPGEVIFRRNTNVSFAKKLQADP